MKIGLGIGVGTAAGMYLTIYVVENFIKIDPLGLGVLFGFVILPLATFLALSFLIVGKIIDVREKRQQQVVLTSGDVQVAETVQEKALFPSRNLLFWGIGVSVLSVASSEISRRIASAAVADVINDFMQVVSLVAYGMCLVGVVFWILYFITKPKT